MDMPWPHGIKATRRCFNRRPVLVQVCLMRSSTPAGYSLWHVGTYICSAARMAVCIAEQRLILRGVFKSTMMAQDLGIRGRDFRSGPYGRPRLWEKRRPTEKNTGLNGSARLQRK